jgi:protein CpxP
MKLKFLIMLCLFTGTAFTMYAQPGGGFQRRTVPERVAIVHAKLDSAFKPSADKLAKLDAVFTDYYTAQDAKRQELMAGGMPDRETMMAEMKKLADARDEKLKGILTADEYKTWKDPIEPSLRPQRPPGGGGGGGGR